eukprot:TRINITY_DN8972_c0_g1_i1.p1 TRINITY_DN8972_c0_g1~~TRINITY_DN8972_c0_g1_i1.p1  ORF type:complete len:372 (+),score=64.94 TRINITY_DN8972_c0_g1_i1:186-1301(+)
MNIGSDGSDVESGAESNASSEQHGEIRVGPEYQAVLPHQSSFYDIDEVPRRLAHPRQLWAPERCALTELELETFVKRAKELCKDRHSLDQILGVLYWHDFDQEATLSDLQDLDPHPDYNIDWSLEDVHHFEKLFAKHGKHFDQIAKKMPHKPLGNIIKFYYRWKKTRRVDKRVLDSMAWEDGEDPNDHTYEPPAKRNKALQRRDSPKTLTQVVQETKQTSASAQVVTTLEDKVGKLRAQFDMVKAAIADKRNSLKMPMPDDLKAITDSMQPLAASSAPSNNYAGESAKLAANHIETIREAVQLYGQESTSLIAIHASASFNCYFSQQEVAMFIASNPQILTPAPTAQDGDSTYVAIKTADNLSIPVTVSRA